MCLSGFFSWLSGWQVCGAVKDSTGEDSTQESPDTNQAEIVTTATGKNAKPRGDRAAACQA